MYICICIYVVYLVYAKILLKSMFGSNSGYLFVLFCTYFVKMKLITFFFFFFFKDLAKSGFVT